MENHYSDIEKLAELRDKGLLTEQEFQQKKNQILSNQQPNSTQQPKKKTGCLKIFGISFIALCVMSTITAIFSDDTNTANTENTEIVETKKNTPDEEIQILEKELENKNLTKAQREEIEIELKSIRTLQFANKHISSWDRSNPELKKYVKKSMNDPKSFEHVSTEFSYGKKNVTAKMIYRGNNAFGAKVLGAVKGTLDYNGNLLEVQDIK